MVHRGKGHSCNPREIGYSLAYEFKRVRHQKKKQSKGKRARKKREQNGCSSLSQKSGALVL